VGRTGRLVVHGGDCGWAAGLLLVHDAVLAATDVVVGVAEVTQGGAGAGGGQVKSDSNGARLGLWQVGDTDSDEPARAEMKSIDGK
jgi:hypothetical protein